jgi:hypothetical protein
MPKPIASNPAPCASRGGWARFGGLQIERGNQFDGRVVGDDDYFVVAEFVGEAGGVVEDAVAFGGEMCSDVLEAVGEDGVLGGIEGFETEAGFEIWEGGEHEVILDFGFLIAD